MFRYSYELAFHALWCRPREDARSLELRKPCTVWESHPNIQYLWTPGQDHPPGRAHLAQRPAGPTPSEKTNPPGEAVYFVSKHVDAVIGVHKAPVPVLEWKEERRTHCAIECMASLPSALFHTS